jgi:phenylpropionate dioxygenase-like ring-hydroxylating dioxygenase large terminal subunit
MIQRTQDVVPPPGANAAVVLEAGPAGIASSAYPRSWYLLCRSSEVRRGHVIARDFLGDPVVIFRGAGSHVHVLAAHCWHMGAHLGKGAVIGDHVRCPLHHWEWDGCGVCRSRSHCAGNQTDEPRQQSFAVVEKYGAVFVFNGPEALFEPPTFSQVDGRDFRTLIGRPATIDCPWEALVANGFDVQHLEAVHGRALREPALIERPDRWRFRLRYVSRVTGSGLADRAMKWISGDHIAVMVTCFGGTVITVQSRAGRSHSNLMLGVLPTERDRTTITPIFAVRQGGWSALHAAQLVVSRWLFTSFLEKDVAVMERMRWLPRVDGSADSAALGQMLGFLSSLPQAKIS